MRNLDQWVPYLQELGITALYIGPLFESSTHGYDTKDYFKVDRRLGTNDDLCGLIKKCHDAGIRVVLDAVFNHVGRDFFAFEDLRNNGWDSRYRSWFHTDFRRQSCYGDRFWYEGWNEHYNLVKLHHNDPQVQQYFADVVRYWIREFDIDGLRFDAADVIDRKFFKQMRHLCKPLKNDFWLMGEVIHGDYRLWVNNDSLDSVTNYECYKGLWSSHNNHNYFEIAYSLNRQYGAGGIYRGLCLYNFVDNHDVDRVASKLKDTAHLHTLYILLFTLPDIPSLYYGSEWGIQGLKGPDTDQPLRPVVDITSSIGKIRSTPIFRDIKQLIELRKRIEPLRRGDYAPLLTASEQYCFLRQHGNDAAVVCVNAGRSTCTAKFQVRFENGILFTDALDKGECYVVENGHLTIPLPPCGGRILLKQ
jgi:glycosidase